MIKRCAGLATLLAVLCAAGCGQTYGLPLGATTQARAMHQDWTIFFYAGIAVAIVVSFLIVMPLIAWRRRSDTYPPQFSRNNFWEITSTAIPVLMVIVLFGVTYFEEAAVEQLKPHPENTVNVVAFRWSWEFDYPGSNVRVVGTPQAAPQMVIPIDQTTLIHLTSRDVNHAFWIPGFLFKRDAIAGIDNYFDLRPTHLGRYLGRCAEFCGLDHALMTFSVRVVSRADYERWLRSGGSAALPAIEANR
ncbi:MAG: cytochrome c oxidase subunit II [Candidatus Eremiobacteraeota bacterium]|nr:cytochrome c oxidase subunit II [Candidatus Eremiobacteraeota bacterium]